MPKKVRRRWSQDERAEILRRFHEGGLTQEAFSRQEGMHSSVLGNWLRKERDGARRRQGVVPVRLKNDAPNGSAIEIVVEGGRRICVSPGFDEEFLRQVIAALERC